MGQAPPPLVIIISVQLPTRTQQSDAPNCDFYLAQFLYSSVFVIIVASALYLSALSLPPPIILPHHYGKDTRQREFTVGDGSVSA